MANVSKATKEVQKLLRKCKKENITNIYTVTGNVVTLWISLNRGWQQVLFEKNDLKLISEHKWYINKGYAVTTDNKFRMNRLIKKMYNQRYQKYNKKLIVDYIDGDTLNNIETNLRIATRGQDAKNVTKTHDRANNTSGYKGVSYHIRMHKYAATIGVNNKFKWLGAFDTALEAAKAYDEAARAFHGEFAYLNFPRRQLTENKY